MYSFHVHVAGHQHVISHRPRFYRLPDGTLLRVETQPAWCHGCRAFVEAECVRSLEQLDQTIIELQYFRDSPGHIPPGRIVRLDSLAEMEVRRAWRAGRSHPARCLECGASAPFLLAEDARGVDVPGVGCCDVTVRRFSGDGQISLLFTTEGLQIRNSIRRASAFHRTRIG